MWMRRRPSKSSACEDFMETAKCILSRFISRFRFRTDAALTIKAEPRADVSDENDDDAEEIDVGDDSKAAPSKTTEDGNSDREGDEEDIEDDDLDDLDFELDSSENPDSPDSWNGEDDAAFESASGRGSSAGSSLSSDATPGTVQL